MVNLSRWLKHTFIPPWRWRLSFSPEVLKTIEIAVKQSETKHRGELRFAIENALAPGWVWHGMRGRHRAVEVFSNLRVWDTEENSGVLIYVLLADKEVHILADRGLNRCVGKSEWDGIARLMQAEFRKGDFKNGALAGIAAITELLAKHYPALSENVDELPNRPVIIKK